MVKELTMDHPLFTTSIKSTFQAIVKSVDPSIQSATRKKQRIESSEESIASFSSNTATYEDWVWAEVLCAQQGHYKSKSTENTKHFRWTHVDPQYELFNKPKVVEAIDRESGKPPSSRSISRMKSTVSFVVAVEHKNDIQIGQEDHVSMNHVAFSTKLTDVTPRYANKWSHTLKLRGSTAKDLAKNGGKCSNKWWSSSMKKINGYYMDQRRKLGLSRMYNEKSRIDRKSTPAYKLEESDNGKEIVVLQDSSDDDDATQNHEDSLKDHETKEFASSKEKEAIPTSRAAFKNHPLYAIRSQLKQQEVVAPDAKKRICGMFKGEVIYKRSDISTAYTQKKWLYQNRKVRERELVHPAKIIKSRKKPAKKGFQALQSYGTSTEDQVETLKDFATDENDGNDNLYGIWQTDDWSPDVVGPNDPIPVNEFKNIELALINPGLEHIELRNIAKVAKKLNIPYAPCLLGFEGHGGNRTPTIRGIVVHEHNAELLREAHVEWVSLL
jgi:xeroderma pigmentosum group C-complementing protein